MSSNFLIDYSYLGAGGNIAGTVVMLVLSIAAVGFRFWGRKRAKLPLKSDDWLILISLILFSGMSISLFIAVGGRAAGYPTPKVPPGSPPNAFLFTSFPEQQLLGKVEAAILWQQMWQLGTGKASVVMFYRRIFWTGKPQRWFTIATITVLLLISLWTVIFFFILLFACGTHFSGFWTTLIAHEMDCAGSNVKQMALSITDFVIDILIIILPLPIIWHLHMPRRRKIAVSGVFLLGALAIAASCLRMAVFISVDVAYINPKQDGDWTVDLYLFWSIIESGLVILAACLPSLTFLGHKLDLLRVSAARSIRSAFSLQSIRSKASGGSRGKIETEKERSGSQDSEFHMTRIRGEPAMESKVEEGVDDTPVEELPTNGIVVKRSFELRELKDGMV